MAKSTRSRTETKPLISARSMEFLKRYIDNASPVGFESSGQQLWLEYLKPFIDSHFTDPYGTAVGVINPKASFKVVIEAHADEISWFVNYITPEGLLYLKRNGGVDHQTAPAQRVFVHGKKGKVPGVFGWPAIHTRMANSDSKEPQPKVDTLFLDCGARNKKEVESLGIHIGSVVTYQDGFGELAFDYLVGRAFDNLLLQRVDRIADRRSCPPADGKKKETPLRSVYRKCGPGRGRSARCRNDRPPDQTPCRHRNGCHSRYGYSDDQ